MKGKREEKVDYDLEICVFFRASCFYFTFANIGSRTSNIIMRKKVSVFN